MTLLFITQKLHGQDVFAQLWVRAFIKRGYTVKVLCLEDRISPQEFEIHSMGKEKGRGKVGEVLSFYKNILSLDYDRVFIHMNPVWGFFGWPVWTLIKRRPVYLWYTHYKMQIGLKMLGYYAKRMFCATPQSLPQYEGSPKKVVTGHGIDMPMWPKRQNVCEQPEKLLMVHRLARSKRIELSLRAMLLIPDAYTLDIYGIEAEADYTAEMKALTRQLGLDNRVTFHGTVPMTDLPAIYVRHRLILNMASETIDKTMLEAMTCGCYPVTTKLNADAIGIPVAPMADTPEAIKDTILSSLAHPPLSPDEMHSVVARRHSLEGLVAKMDAYIHDGI